MLGWHSGVRRSGGRVVRQGRRHFQPAAVPVGHARLLVVAFEQQREHLVRHRLVGDQRVHAEQACARVHLPLIALRRVLRDGALQLAERHSARGAQLGERRRLAVLHADQQLHPRRTQTSLVEEHHPLLQHLAPVEDAFDFDGGTAEQLVLVDVLVPREDRHLLARAGREDGAQGEHLVPHGSDRVSQHVGLRACAAGLDDHERVGAERHVLGLADRDQQRRHAGAGHRHATSAVGARRDGDDLGLGGELRSVR